MDLSTPPKLTLWVEEQPGQFTRKVEALFNPNQLTVQKTSQWQLRPKNESDTSETQFTHGDPATLAVELMFDTYTYKQGQDVRNYTKQVFALTTIQDHGNLHRPPLCRIEWGTFNMSADYDCEWVLKSLNQRFTLFRTDGTPMRAVLGCTFQQWRGDQTEAKLLRKSSPDVAKTRILRRDDTLSSIAAEEYDDPTLWRVIARANHIRNPRTIDGKIGTALLIPALTAQNGQRRM